MYDGGERVSLLETILAECQSKVGPESRDVCGAASQEHSVDISRFDRCRVERSPDRLADNVQLGSDHRLER
jgi:hypothetical protein